MGSPSQEKTSTPPVDPPHGDDISDKKSFLKSVKALKNPRLDYDIIEKAFELSEKAHTGQKRNTGEPYIVHPIAVALKVAEWGLDTPTVSAALMHDVVEDTDIPLGVIEKEFGPDTAFLISAVTKLNPMVMPNLGEAQRQTLQKLVLSMAKDVRAILIKLADRLHNLKTAQGLPQQKRVLHAEETLELYAPIANRLGMGDLRGELEDLAFPTLFPEEAKWMHDHFGKNLEERKSYVERILPELKVVLDQAKIDTKDIHARVKHTYSLYQKLLRYHRDISKVYDLVAVRVIVAKELDCYLALGVIHRAWPPLPGRVKDYIASPKPNGYQSLHTTVFGPNHQIIEIQIRTPLMHEEAERGIAAHWKYREGQSGNPLNNALSSFGSLTNQLTSWFRREEKFDEKINEKQEEQSWTHQLSRWKQEIEKPGVDVVQAFKIDFFQDRTYVYTPTGDVKDLPVGSTPIDFAFSIHTDLGRHALRAFINDQPAGLSQPLETGDVVHVIADPTRVTVERSWLETVQTQLARSMILKELRAMDPKKMIEIGTDLLSAEIRRLGKGSLENISHHALHALLKEIQCHSLQDLAIKIGFGDLHAANLARSLIGSEEVLGVPRMSSVTPHQLNQAIMTREGESIKTPLHLSPECHPTSDTTIIGYRLRHGGIMVHREDCILLQSTEEDTRILLAWKKVRRPIYAISFTVTTEKDPHLIEAIAHVMNRHDAPLHHISSESPRGSRRTVWNVTTDVHSLPQVQELLARLEQLPGVLRAELNPPTQRVNLNQSSI